jgi:sulfur carrier protein
MITIYLNNEAQTLCSNCTLQEIVEENNRLNQPVAVAVNQQFVPSASFADIVLKDQDRIDVVTPMQGG